MAKTKSNALTVLSEGKLSKKYPTMLSGTDIKLSPKSQLRLPSRIIPLNYQLNGGILYGTILELFGEESTGKSLLANDFAVCAQELGGWVIWPDAEGTFNASWAEKNGIDLGRIDVLQQENAIEVISDFIKDMVILRRSKLVNNEPIAVVLDSTAALDCLENINSSQVDGRAEMGNRAKAIYKFLRIRNSFFSQMGICVILINQLRKKVGAKQWEDPDTTPGGSASKFFASQRVGLVRGKQIKAKFKSGAEKKVGQNVYIKTKKDKTGPPRGTTESQVYFIKSSKGDVGFDRYQGLIPILEDLKVVQRKKGSSRFYVGEKMIANGEDNFVKLLKENPELRRELIAKSKINTISNTRTKLDSITENLYPVKIKSKS